MPQELSGGMRKRAGLARALAMNPNIIFYDEPSAGLDPVSAGRIDRLILERAQSGTAQIVVTHEMGSAFRIADRMVLLHQGQMVAEGTPEEFQNSSDPRIRQFVEGGAEGPWRSRHHESPRHQYRSHCHRQPHHHRDVDRLGRWSKHIDWRPGLRGLLPGRGGSRRIGEGDPVRLGGHTISKVESVDVEIPSDNPDKPVVVVGFRLPDSVPLRNGAQVEVQTSFTGVASLNITSIGVGDLLDAGDRLAGQASSIQRITEAITSLAPDISAAVDEIRTKIVPEITEAADAFQMTLAEANATLAAYRGVAEQVQADDGTLARLDRAILGLDDTIEKIGLNVDRVGLDVSTVVQDFRAEDGLMVQLESGVASFEEAMSSLGIVFGEGGPDLTSAAGSIREAADGLPLAVGELRAAFEDLRRELNDDSGTLATIREAAGKADSALEEVRSLWPPTEIKWIKPWWPRVRRWKKFVWA